MEAAVRSYLHTMLADYVTGLNNTEIKLPLTLRNLQLKPETVNKEMEDVPFDLTNGKIGFISLKPNTNSFGIYDGTFEVVASDITLNLSYSMWKMGKNMMGGEQDDGYYEPSPPGSPQHMRQQQPQQPPKNVAPCYCRSHDTSEKREKDPRGPQSCRCETCNVEFQTTYVGAKLCQYCSSSQGKCIICGNRDAAPQSGYIPATTTQPGRNQGNGRNDRGASGSYGAPPGSRGRDGGRDGGRDHGGHDLPPPPPPAPGQGGRGRGGGGPPPDRMDGRGGSDMPYDSRSRDQAPHGRGPHDQGYDGRGPGGNPGLYDQGPYGQGPCGQDSYGGPPQDRGRGPPQDQGHYGGHPDQGGYGQGPDRGAYGNDPHQQGGPCGNGGSTGAPQSFRQRGVQPGGGHQSFNPQQGPGGGQQSFNPQGPPGGPGGDQFGTRWNPGPGQPGPPRRPGQGNDDESFVGFLKGMFDFRGGACYNPNSVDHRQNGNYDHGGVPDRGVVQQGLSAGAPHGRGGYH